MSCNEWKDVKLVEIANFKNGKAIKQSLRKEDGANIIYGSNGIIGKTDEVLVNEMCLIIGRVGAYCGSVQISYKPSWVTDNAIICTNKESTNLKYLYYFLSKFPLRDFAGGSAQPLINQSILNDLEIRIPPLEEQVKIANILSSLDDKIELNNEMNKTLEEMAQSIFKRWFVDFEFPNEEGQPYKSSGGEMVDSELGMIPKGWEVLEEMAQSIFKRWFVDFEFPNEEGQPYKSSGGEMVDSELGMIPKGWEVKCIYDLAEYINGTSFKAKDYSEKGLPIIKIAELKNGITDGTKFFSGEKDKKFYLKNGDILFSWSGNPDTSIDTFIWDKGDAILNQHIFKVIPKFDKGYAFTYLMLKYLKSTFTHIARNKQTTGLGHVTVKDLKELKIALCFSKIKEFNEVAEPMVDLIFENNMSIEQLNKIRDSLLPKLMSGEIKV